ncbi:N-acetylmuramidase family protein [Larkinella soli]|uniref:N-acetylmuramidase family protein n=1 Tax=Larkinella soli TaxID=1770527 RepID=UPI000FFCB952|nr:N-acetylmuramidase family protein [Larkinella soli]
MAVKTTLTDADFQQAADLLGVEVATVKAVADVEAAGKGFLNDGRLVLRFEGHWFRKLTNRIYDVGYPTISHPYFADGRYNKGPAKDYKRLAVAMKLSPDAALQSTSWGMFQIMGFNAWRCGFQDVHAFVDAMKLGVHEHLLAFCRFCISKGLADELRAKDWAGFAAKYNGENYRDNHYDLKLAAAYRHYKEQEG